MATEMIKTLNAPETRGIKMAAGLAEEAGETVKAAIHCAEGRETVANLRGEMLQTVAMLYRLWVEGDQVHGLKPVYQDGTP